MLLECLMIIGFVSTTWKFVEPTLQITGINTSALLLLLVLNKAGSVILKDFIAIELFKHSLETYYAKLNRSSAIPVYKLL